MYYLNYFFVFSIFGYIYETIIYKLMHTKIDSGFLYGYWTPVYGIGVVLIIYISRKLFKKLKLNKILEVIILLIIMFFVLTFTEFIGGHILHFIFHKDFWNYTNHKYNLGKYIALDVSLIWIFGTLIFLYLIKPWMDKIIVKIPKSVTYILILLFLLDLTCTFMFRNKLI